MVWTQPRENKRLIASGASSQCLKYHEKESACHLMWSSKHCKVMGLRGTAAGKKHEKNNAHQSISLTRQFKN